MLKLVPLPTHLPLVLLGKEGGEGFMMTICVTKKCLLALACVCLCLTLIVRVFLVVSNLQVVTATYFHY
jgi:hypothetical protein